MLTHMPIEAQALAEAWAADPDVMPDEDREVCEEAGLPAGIPPT